MTAEEIVKAARDAGFGSSEMHQRLAEFKRLIDSAVAAEREACATLCEDMIIASNGGGRVASAIRARGNHA